jgi:glycosyltransferase involved in cell wall biosynthesis
MKILHINTERTWRGGEQQTLYLLEGLKARAIACHLVCQAGSPLQERADEAGIDVFPVVMRGEADLFAGMRIRRLIKKYSYSIIHSHTSHAHTIAYLASVGTAVRRLVTRRVDFSIFRSSFLHLSGFKYRFMADDYIAISNRIKAVLVNDGISDRRIFVVHSGVDPERFRQASGDHLRSEFDIKDHEKIVINVAHLAGHKGQKYLIRAIPYVLTKMPNTRFFIVGRGELMEELQALASSLRLKGQLVFTGFRGDVGDFYKIADLYVMSSVEEGLGTAVLDAMAAGKPVVATTAGGLPEIVCDGKTGRLVAPADPAALAEGMLDLLTRPELADAMAAEARAKVRQCFSIQAMVDKNIEVYRKILATDDD